MGPDRRRLAARRDRWGGACPDVPTPNDQRHRFTLAAWGDAPAGIRLSAIWTMASAVPMDILMPAGQSRVPVFQRNAGGRLFKTAADLNRALTEINNSGGISGQLLPLVSQDARFGDPFSSVASVHRGRRPRGAHR